MSGENLSKEMVLRDLQSLLKEQLGDRMIVDNFITKPLLSFGENFGSTILSVEATIKRDDTAKKENLHLIAKMLPATEFQRKLFDSHNTFKKEISMYNYIAPLYRRLEIEHEEVFDVWPKFYGSRLTVLDSNVTWDENAVILLENLQVLDYYTCNRVTGVDIEHARFAIRALAKFHALGIVVKEKHPEEFEMLKERSKTIEFKKDGWQIALKAMLEKMSEDSEILPYYSRCESILLRAMEDWKQEPPEEPWSTIVHDDFWVNNIMFHRNNQNGRVDDIKFVDFQNYLFSSPQRELLYFVFSSVQIDVYQNHFDELIDLYHDNLFNTLRKFTCNIESYSRKQFDLQLPVDVKHKLLHIFFMLKMITLDMKNTDYTVNDTEKVLHSCECNQEFIDRVRAFILFLGKKNWI